MVRCYTRSVLHASRALQAGRVDGGVASIECRAPVRSFGHRATPKSGLSSSVRCNRTPTQVSRRLRESFIDAESWNWLRQLRNRTIAAGRALDVQRGGLAANWRRRSLTLFSTRQISSPTSWPAPFHASSVCAAASRAAMSSALPMFSTLVSSGCREGRDSEVRDYRG